MTDYEIIQNDFQFDDSSIAEFNDESKEIITDFLGGTLNKYNALSGVSEDMLKDSKIVDALANFLSITVEGHMNEKFHNSLGLLERNGIISDEKLRMHIKSVNRAKTATSIGVYAAFTITPLLVDTFNSIIQKKNMTDFLIGSYAYINGEQNLLMISSIEEVFREMGLSMKREKISKIFSKYAEAGKINKIPVLNEKNRSSFPRDQIEILGKKIVSQCDLTIEQTKERALEFLVDLLGITTSQGEELIIDAKNSQQFLSDFTWFSALSFTYLYPDFINGVEHALKFSKYDIENDIYNNIRNERKDKMQRVIENVSSINSILMTANKRKDIIETSARMMQYSLNPDYDVAKDFKMIKRAKKVLELYAN